VYDGGVEQAFRLEVVLLVCRIHETLPRRWLRKSSSQSAENITESRHNRTLHITHWLHWTSHNEITCIGLRRSLIVCLHYKVAQCHSDVYLSFKPQVTWPVCGMCACAAIFNIERICLHDWRPKTIDLYWSVLICIDLRVRLYVSLRLVCFNT